MKRAANTVAEAEYFDLKKSSNDKSSVWFYFLRSKDGATAKCKQCEKVLKSGGFSTSSLRSHLRTQHSVNLEKISEYSELKSNNSVSVASSTSDTNRDVPQKTSTQFDTKKKITDYFQTDNSVEHVVSKMAALDGLPFKTFCSSEELRKLFTKSGHKLPTSPNSIKKMVIDANKQLQNTIIQEIEELKAKEVKFAVTLDEWTSNRNRRYMNINVFSPRFKDKYGVKNLGLVRINKKGTAQHCLEILKTKLSNFGISLDADVICLTTDGASVMTAMARAANVKQQLCLAHGIQLGVIDVLYKDYKINEEITEPSENEQARSQKDKVEEIVEENSSESEESDEDDGFNVCENRRIPVAMVAVNKDLINKVRKAVKTFRKSPTKSDILSKHVMADHGNKDLMLILDCKTRWSSMADMLSRFLKLKDSLSKALIDLKSNIQFSDTEIQTLTAVSESLNVIKATVEVLCQRDANLITAVTALNFMLKKLHEHCSTVSLQLAHSLEKRIVQRLTEYTGILMYLHSPTNYYKNAVTQHGSINQAIALNNDEVRKNVVNIINKHFMNTRYTSSQEIQDVEEVVDVKQMSIASNDIKEQLGLEIKNVLKQRVQSNRLEKENSLDLETHIRVEMALYDEGGTIGDHLSKVYEALISIPPTSVESERAFSSAGLLCNKIRSSLNDESLDALVSLRSFYQAKK